MAAESAKVRANDIEEFLDVSKICPSQSLDDKPRSSSANLHENPAYVTWKKQDQMLLSWLLSSISIEVLSLVVHLKMLLNNLNKASLTMTEYFSKLRSITDELAIAGSPKNNYNAGWNNNNNQGNYTGNFGNRTEGGNYGRGNPGARRGGNTGYGTGRGQWHGNQGGNQGRGGFSGFNENGFTANFNNSGRGSGRGIICQICFKPNHSAAECRNRFNQNFVPNPPVQSSFPNQNQGLRAAYMVTSERVADQGWYLDSGATHHLTNAVQNLTVGKSYSGSEMLLVGNGKGLSITHIGYTYFYTSLGTLLHLTDMLCVPHLTKNLISVSKLLANNNVIIEFTYEFCFVKDKVKGTLLAQGITEGGLYKLLSQDDLFSNSEVQVLKPNFILSVVSNKIVNSCPESVKSVSVNSVSFNNSPASFNTSSCISMQLLHNRLELFSASRNSFSIPTKCVTPANQSFTHFSMSNPHLDDSNVVAPPMATSGLRSGTQLPAATPEPSSPLSQSPASTNIPSISSGHSISIHPMVTRAKSGIFKPKTYLAATQDIEPTSVKTTLSSQKWYMAMKEEVDALHRNQTWTLVPSDSANKIVGNKWIFRVKYNPDGSISKYKARLVAKVLTEDVYMHQPEGFIDSRFPSHICKLNNVLYGLKQAPRAWYDQLKGSLVQWGFQTSKSDTSLFIKHTGADILVFLIYVDDILITGSNPKLVEEVISKLGSTYALKDLGEFNYFLGIEVTPSLDGLHLSQTKYIGDILQKAHMLDSKGYNTPMSTTEKLRKENGALFENPSLYRSIIGSLQYVTLTRPDIAFSVNKLSQFLAAPTVLHWQACKRVLRYLQGTSNYGLQFLNSGSLSLNAYSNADWGSNPDDRKSIGESEYITLALAASEMLWVTYLLKELKLSLLKLPVLYCDNKSAEALASNPKYHSRTKHIELDLHFVRDHIAKHEFSIDHVPSFDQLADILTKPLAYDQFAYLRNKLNVSPKP
ncbi:retrovirus-related pol polyprotein from transposon RE1 [Citrus sinensis]|uniref:Retrovirus-related pol polyprotein from transposon RE1 n=1 Tax=Citrus sinensis TaxID=2711 RepID=A0ACB8ML81_CITSI|nr:retrovirus-related pol polyprotein from transposon RE1 [Citrus sinensis]